MDRRDLLKRLGKMGVEQAKQQTIKNVLPEVPIQIKRAAIDAAELMTEAEQNPIIDRRNFIKKLLPKVQVRHNPMNTEESLAHMPRRIFDAFRNTKFSYMSDVAEFANLTRKDYLVAGGILGTGTLGGVGIGYMHNKVLHQDPSNTELGHDVISHGFGEGMLPAGVYLAARRMT